MKTESPRTSKKNSTSVSSTSQKLQMPFPLGGSSLMPPMLTWITLISMLTIALSSMGLFVLLVFRTGLLVIYDIDGEVRAKMATLAFPIRLTFLRP
ncbi:hypothetical protein NL676_019247 [Syzygium grande]|nr:hypothetical protein NL676_019247 [Syzygium grande]